MPRKLLLICRLAAWDMAHEWRLAACLIAALCAVLVPLLILFGLKEGVIHQWSERLLASPGGRQLVLERHLSLDNAWFEEIRQWQDVAFVMPDMFSASQTMDIMKDHGRTGESRVDIILSGIGDPLLGETNAPLSPPDIVLSYGLAQALGIKPGDSVQAGITRTYNEKPERIVYPMQVSAVLKADQISKKAAFVSLAFATAVESYKDGRKVKLFDVIDGSTDTPAFPPYPGARIYAKALDDVVPLADRLSALQVPTVLKEGEVRQMQQAKMVLDRLFWVIAGLGLAGMLFSLSASLWANIDRKRLDFALLTLLGVRKGDLLLFPIAQTVLIVIVGFILAVAIYVVSARWINWLFGNWIQMEESATRLLPYHAAAIGAVVLAVGILAALLGGYRMMKVEPIHALRS